MKHTSEQRAERVFAADLAAGKLTGLRAVMSVMHVGQPKARDVLAPLASLVTGQRRPNSLEVIKSGRPAKGGRAATGGP